MAALVLAPALVSQIRLEAASAVEIEVLRLSFGRTVVLVRSLWLTLAAGDGIISRKQAEVLTRQMLAFLAEEGEEGEGEGVKPY